MAAVRRPRISKKDGQDKPPPPPPVPQRLPIVQKTLVGSDDPSTSLEVFCPSQEATVSADRCAECGFLRAYPDHPEAPGAVLDCVPPDLERREAARVSPRIDMPEKAARTPLGEFIRKRFVFVTPETGVEKLVSLMVEHSLDAVAVVDDKRMPVGIVSKSDVVRLRCTDDDDEIAAPHDPSLERGLHEEPRAGQTVADVMTPIVHTLPEDARLSHAVSLMAQESIHQVPLVAADGHVVGMVSSLDCMRWMAKEMGYDVDGASGDGALPSG